MISRKNKASRGAGPDVARLQAKATKSKNVLNCDSNRISKICRELAQNGLALSSSSGDSQLAMLPKVLKYLGARGLSTYEGTAAGYLRIATRIKELKVRWEIISIREDVIGPDGLFHKNIARYILIGERENHANSQLAFDLEVRDENL